MTLEELKLLSRTMANQYIAGALSAPEVVFMATQFDAVRASYLLIAIHDYVPYALRRDLDNAIERHLRA